MGLMKLQQHLLQTPHQHEATRSADMGISGVKTSTQVTWLRIQCSFYCSTRQYDMLYRALETNHGPTTDQLFHLCVALISLSLHTPYVVEMLTEPCLRFAVRVNETIQVTGTVINQWKSSVLYPLKQNSTCYQVRWELRHSHFMKACHHIPNQKVP